MDEVTICNQALGWLGEPNITSFEDGTKAAGLCKVNYPILRDAVIEARGWYFASVTYVSASVGEPGEQPDFPAWGDGFVHAIPADWLQVFQVYTNIDGPEKVQAQWYREGNYIVANSNRVYMKGVTSVEDSKDFSVLFTQALAARIAADLAIPLTGDKTMQANMWSLYNDKLIEAASRSGQQARSERITASRLLNARGR
jgi:hypothetical protein